MRPSATRRLLLIRRISGRVLLFVVCLATAQGAGSDEAEEGWARIEDLLEGCGEVCDTSIAGNSSHLLASPQVPSVPSFLIFLAPCSISTQVCAGVESLFFPRITKDVDCGGLWRNAAIDRSLVPSRELKNWGRGGRGLGCVNRF